MPVGVRNEATTTRVLIVKKRITNRSFRVWLIDETDRYEKEAATSFTIFQSFFYFLSLYFSPSLRQSRSAYSLGKETPRAGTPDTPGLSGRPPTEFGGKDTPNAHASHIREDRKPGHGARHPSRRCSAAAVDSRHIPEPPRRDPWPAPFGSRPQTR